MHIFVAHESTVHQLVTTNLLYIKIQPYPKFLSIFIQRNHDLGCLALLLKNPACENVYLRHLDVKHFIRSLLEFLLYFFFLLFRDLFFLPEESEVIVEWNTSVIWSYKYGLLIAIQYIRISTSGMLHIINEQSSLVEIQDPLGQWIRLIHIEPGWWLRLKEALFTVPHDIVRCP